MKIGGLFLGLKATSPQKEFVNYVIRPLAKDDILRQHRYYLLADAFDAGLKFLDAVADSIERICASSESFTEAETSTESSIKNGPLLSQHADCDMGSLLRRPANLQQRLFPLLLMQLLHNREFLLRLSRLP